MLTLTQIKEQLNAIRYYYANEENINNIALKVGENGLREIVDKYNTAILSAPIRLYDVYAKLYVYGNTQEGLANMLNYSPQYIHKLNKQLLLYFQSYFNN
jgi:hypothetical protein